MRTPATRTPRPVRPCIDCWVRFRRVPEDPPLHAGLLAQFTGHMPIAAALRPHQGIGQSAAHRTLTMGINAISLSLHRQIRADDWMLYHHLSSFAGDGHDARGVPRLRRGAATSWRRSVWTPWSGPFAAGSGDRDERTAM